MPVYLVDRDLPGISPDGLEAIHQAALAACRQFCDTGQAIRYVHSVFIPGEQRCLCLFDGHDEALAAAVNESAGLPFTRIVAAMSFTPEGDGGANNRLRR